MSLSITDILTGFQKLKTSDETQDEQLDLRPLKLNKGKERLAKQETHKQEQKPKEQAISQVSQAPNEDDNITEELAALIEAIDKAGDEQEEDQVSKEIESLLDAIELADTQQHMNEDMNTDINTDMNDLIYPQGADVVSDFLVYAGCITHVVGKQNLRYVLFGIARAINQGTKRQRDTYDMGLDLEIKAALLDHCCDEDTQVIVAKVAKRLNLDDKHIAYTQTLMDEITKEPLRIRKLAMMDIGTFKNRIDKVDRKVLEYLALYAPFVGPLVKYVDRCEERYVVRMSDLRLGKLLLPPLANSIHHSGPIEPEHCLAFEMDIPE